MKGKRSREKKKKAKGKKWRACGRGAADTAGEGLEGSINQLAHSVPEVFANKNAPTQPAKPSGSTSALANSSGLIGQAITLMDLIRGVHEIDQMIKETEGLRQDAEDLRKPLHQTLPPIIHPRPDLPHPTATPPYS